MCDDHADQDSDYFHHSETSLYALAVSNPSLTPIPSGRHYCDSYHSRFVLLVADLDTNGIM